MIIFIKYAIYVNMELFLNKYFKRFLVLISNKVNTDRYNP